MHFFRGKDFAEYITANFPLAHGSIIVHKAEELGSEDEDYLFLYGPPYKRNEEKVTFKGQTGVYIFYANWFHMTQENIVKAIEKWHGASIEEVIGTHAIDGGLEVLVRLPNNSTKFWWNKTGTSL